MKIIQVLNALDFGDGVSNDVVNKRHLLEEMGFTAEIYSKWTDEASADYRKDIKELRAEKGDIILHHYSGKSHITDEVKACGCTKVMIYHNITPPEFFDKSAVNYKECEDGLKQLSHVAQHYDYFLGVSPFNLENLRGLGVQGEMDVLPSLAKFDQLEECRNSRIERVSSLRKTFLFVGRIAPNKKQEDIIDIFDYYFTYINANSRLILVGNYSDEDTYYRSLRQKVEALPCKDNIVFTGKVSDEQLHAQYTEADCFICMSEHEGFCLPLVESMHCRIPTIAYDSCAIKSTMGGAGVLVGAKNSEKIARLCHTIFTCNEFEKSILDKQSEWAATFSKEHIRARLGALIEKWSGGVAK